MPERMKAAMAAIEFKYLDTNFPLNAVLSNGSIMGSVNIIPQGDTEVMRDGRKCVIKSIWIKGHMQVPQLGAVPTVTTNHENLTLKLVLDKQCNGALPSYGDVMQTTDWDGFRNLENSQRFRVLWSRSYNYYPTVATDDATTIVWTFNTTRIDIYKKVNIPLEYSVGTTGVITTIKSNNVFLMGISEKGKVKFHGRIRIRFVG